MFFERNDNSSKILKGYIQQLNKETFGMYMFTEKGIKIKSLLKYNTIFNSKRLNSNVFILGIKILKHHLKSENLSLYIDATGGVVKKPSKMKGKFFYYAIVLPGAGRGRPSLPVAEMLSNGHTVPDVSGFLRKWLYNVKKFSKLLPYKVETDFSYVFIHSVLNVMNTESLDEYLLR